MRFRDRRDAGRILAHHLMNYADCPDVLVLGLPRGGVPVAFEVAQALHAPLDVFLVRKLGVPGFEELAMGAIATGGVRVLNKDVLRSINASDAMIETVVNKEMQELNRREQLYRGERPSPKIAGKTIILIDDGLATGSTMRAAVAALRQRAPARVIVAVPVGARETCVAVQKECDEVICPQCPEPFYAVGAWYRDFSQTTDEEVQTLLRLAANASDVRRPVDPGRFNHDDRQQLETRC